MKNLTWLDLWGNQISDTTTLSGLAQLTYLDVLNNPITDWSPVSHIETVGGRP